MSAKEEAARRNIISKINSGQVMVNMINPMVPLPFEKYDGEPGTTDKSLEEEFKIMNILSGIVVMPEFGPNGDLPDVKDPGLKRRLGQAHNLARRAPTAENPELLADQSLAIAETPEAYMVKAIYCSSSYEEALEYYNLGAEVGKKLMPNLGVGPYKIDAWNISDYTRSYLKVIHGQANTLRKMGRFQEAEEKYKLLFKVNRTYPQGETEYINWRYHFLEVFMKQGKFDEAYRWAKNPLLGDCFDMYSTRGAYYWSFALLDFICNKKRGFEEEYFFLGPTRAKRSEEDFKAPLLRAFLCAPHVFMYLTGKRKLPSCFIPMHMKTSESLSNCLAYVHSNLSLWRETEGAIEWATKVINTFLCYCLLTGEHQDVVKSLDIENSDETFKNLVEEGIFVDAVISKQRARLVHLSVEHHSKRLGILLEAGADATGHRDASGLLTLLAYNDYSTSATKLLIKHGCDPYRPAGKKNAGVEKSPLALAASLGHVRQVHTNLTLKRPPADIAEKLIPFIVNSPYYKCYKGIGSKCERCTRTKQPHSKYTDFLSCVTSLLLHSSDTSNTQEGRKSLRESISKNLSQELVPFVSEIQNLLKLTEQELQERFDETKKKKFPACARCEADDNLQKCSRCKSVYYCSKTCQKKHWKSHKPACR